MSASLVGSEMCIRDSGHRRGSRAPGIGCGIGSTHPKDRRSIGSGSVSYTHLTLPTICSV
eukprot:10203120-Alexandrium_andersonii.AAC.1